MTARPPRFRLDRRVPELDGLRGIAIGLVLVWHVFVSPTFALLPEGSLSRFVVSNLLMTWSGVDLFFVLSGFLIGGLLLDNRAAPNLFRVFYVRRACRIFPLYYAWVGVFLVLVRWAPDWVPGGVGQPLPAVSYLTYTQNFVMAHTGGYGPLMTTVTWSLAVEEQFYLLFPWLVVWLPRPALRVGAAVLVLLATPARVGLDAWLGPLAGYVLLPGRWDALLLGVLLADLVRSPAAMAWLSDRVHYVRAGLAVLLIGAFLLSRFSREWLNPFPLGPVMRWGGLTWLALTFAGLVFAAVHPAFPLWRSFLRLRLLRALGVISYGVYLTHQAAWVIGHRLVGNEPSALATAQGMVGALVGLGVCLTFSYVSFRLFESPFLRLGHRRGYAPAPGEPGA